MNRIEFMEKLRRLLSDIDESEREEALAFYEHYFDDAGAENEQKVIASLGSPEKVAQTIKEGLNDADRAQGEFTENGYSGYGETKIDEVGSLEKKSKKAGNGKMILLLILAVFALPILGPILVGIASTIVGVIAACVAVLFALIGVGIALLVVGASAFAAAIGCLVVKPIVSLILFGGALLTIGIGILAMILGIWVVTKTIPTIIRFIVKTVSKLFKKKEAEA